MEALNHEYLEKTLKEIKELEEYIKLMQSDFSLDFIRTEADLKFKPNQSDQKIMTYIDKHIGKSLLVSIFNDKHVRELCVIALNETLNYKKRELQIYLEKTNIHELADMLLPILHKSKYFDYDQSMFNDCGHYEDYLNIGVLCSVNSTEDDPRSTFIYNGIKQQRCPRKCENYNITK